MVPVSLGVLVLDKFGLLGALARLINPLLHLIGLPGSAALVILSSMLLNIYSAIAVIGTLPLSGREITIIAVICLIAHNLIVESAIMRKTGSSAMRMALLPSSVGLFAGWLLNLLLPAGFGAALANGADTVARRESGLAALIDALLPWAQKTGLLLVKMAVIVAVLMVIQKLLEEFGFMEALGRVLSPFMRFIGLPSSTGFLLIVANLVGFAYGSAIMIERVESGKLTLSDGDLFNHHAGISHSLLEDTLLFMAISVPFFWLVVPRVILAIIVVWLERGRRILFRRSFRVGTI